MEFRTFAVFIQKVKLDNCPRGQEQGEEKLVWQLQAFGMQSVNSRLDGKKYPAIFCTFREGMHILIKGEKHIKNTAIHCQLCPGPAGSTAKIFHQFIADSGDWTECQFVPMVNDSLPGFRLDGKIDACGMADNPHHPGGVPLDPYIRLTDKTDYALFQVIDSISVVNDGMVFYFIEYAINGQITSKGII